MKISDLLDLIEDDSVSLREREITASQRIEEVTMAKIKLSEEKRRDSKKGLGRGAILAIAAAACLLLSITAYAVGLKSHVVRWDGTPVEEVSATPIPTPFSTPIPVSDPVFMTEYEPEGMLQALDEYQGKELVIVRDGSIAGSTERIEKLTSLDDLLARLSREHSVLTVPFDVPSGWVFSRGVVEWALDADYSYEQIGSERRDGGLVVERYTAPEEGDFISGYTLVFTDHAGEELTLSGRMEENSQNDSFGVEDLDKVRRVNVPGMDDALVIEYPEYTALFMRSGLPEPISYIFPLGMIREADDPVNEFDGICYRASSFTMEGEEILSIMNPESVTMG